MTQEIHREIHIDQTRGIVRIVDKEYRDGDGFFADEEFNSVELSAKEIDRLREICVALGWL